MTHFSDPIRQGNAYYARRALASGGGFGDTESRGVPHTQTIAYEIGQASTPLASGVFFSTATIAGGTLTGTGALVSGGVATFDAAFGRCAVVTATVDLSTNVFTLRGTDGYGAPLTSSFIGPTGNTAGNFGSYVFSPSAFKTITTASFVGSSTGGLQIGSSAVFGLPFRIANTGKGIDTCVNGSTPLATLLVTATQVPTWAAGALATAVQTASAIDVRGTIQFPSYGLPNGTRFLTAHFIAPPVGLSQSSDTKEASYGVTPFTN